MDNDGIIGPSLVVDGNHGHPWKVSWTATATPSVMPFPPWTLLDGSGTPYDFVLLGGYGTADDYTGIDLAGKIVLCSRGGDYYYYEKANAPPPSLARSTGCI